MSRDDRTRLDDIAEACAAIRAHLTRGSLTDGLVFDAVCMRLVQIGEAAKTITPELLAREPDIPWRQVMRCVTGWHTATSTPFTPSSNRLPPATLTSSMPPFSA